MRLHAKVGPPLFKMAVVWIAAAACSAVFSGCGKKQGTDPASIPGPVTDIDGNVYRTVRIGNQRWMAENLKVTHYRNGDAIPNVTDSTAWNSLGTGACTSYGNLLRNTPVYGLLYNWHSTADGRNIAPEGWHVPTDEDWKELEMTLGMSREEADRTQWRGTEEGGKLKETGTEHWESPNRNATNETGFSAIPGGFRYDNGGFNSFGYYAYFWTSTEKDQAGAWFRYIGYGDSYIFRSGSGKRFGFSVRCVED
ncbi:fibrobacter succinogenes major paralogous domain-containing protein [bacterium]|nr:fibrobacter succinogenes major paralogous domain-containing protein [bacterium]